MTYNDEIQYFQDFSAGHDQIKTFGTGEEWEKEGILKQGILYPIIYFIPIDSTTTENTKVRRFKVACFGKVKKDKTDEQEILSDTEQILDDLVKDLRYNQDDLELIGDPVWMPFKEEYGDFCAGWDGEITIQSQFNNNNCDKP